MLDTYQSDLPREKKKLTSETWHLSRRRWRQDRDLFVHWKHMRLSIRHPRVYATQKIVTGFGVYFICEGKSTIAALENETWEFVFFFSKKEEEEPNRL